MMWNPNQQDGEDDSWEVRAFEQDTKGNISGTTWPPRSYTCTFCRREFRSAQALGGHMNVHRRDRARLHGQTQPLQGSPVGLNLANSSSSSAYTQDYAANFGGLCLFYQFPDHCNPKNPINDHSPPSTLLSISPSYLPHNFIAPSMNFRQVAEVGINSNSHSTCCKPRSFSAMKNNTSCDDENYHEPAVEGLDLELRLGSAQHHHSYKESTI